jgi:hypothetical protein
MSWILSLGRQVYNALHVDDTPTTPLSRQRMIDDLRELITALDRRVPRLEATGEIDIASDAARLRDKAVERIAELQSAS